MSKCTKIVAISGLIGVGKTSVMEGLQKRYSFPKSAAYSFSKSYGYSKKQSLFQKTLFFGTERNLEFFFEPVHTWTNLDLFYKDQKQYALPLQLEILESYQSLKEKTCVVSERSPADSRYIFAELLYSGGLLTDLEWSYYNQVFDEKGFFPTHIIYLDLEPARALQRIKTRNREFEKTITLEYLEGLDAVSKKWLVSAETMGIPVFRVDAALPIGRVTESVDQVLKKIF